MPRVLKRKNFLEPIPKGAVLVARPRKKWSNIYEIGKHGTREEVLAKYRTYALKKLRKGDWDIEELRGKDLVCYCAPLPCHAEFLLELANMPPEERKRSFGF